MSTICRELHIDSCGNTWCDLDVGCRGHDIRLEYQNTTDVGIVYIDGEHRFGGGDDLLQAVADVLNDLWSEDPRYIVPKKPKKELLK